MAKRSAFLSLLVCALGLGLLVLSGLISVLVYFYLDPGPHHELDSILAQRQAAGLPTHWDVVVPAPIPDDQNFCMTPLVLTMMEKADPDNGEADNNPLRKMGREWSRFKEEEKLQTASYSLGRKSNFEEWQKALGKTNRLPAAAGALTPAQATLSYFEQYSPILTQLRKDARRPDARFPVDYDHPSKYAILMPHIGAVMDCSRVLTARAAAFLKNGQPAEAWADLQIIFKFHQALKKEPMLISGLVDLTIVGMTLTVIWEGLADQSWSPAELRQIGQTLAELDFLKQYHHSMNGEWAGFLMSLFDDVQKEPAQLPQVADPEGKSSLHNLYFRLWPANSYTSARITAWKLLEEEALPACDLQKRCVDPDKISDMDAKLAALFPYSPGNIILRLALPAISAAAQKYGEGQADIDMARIACALELFRIENGFYPKALSELSGPLPHDVVDGESYRYRQTADGRYELWSIGWNNSDDGGITRRDSKYPEQSKIDRNQGDWLWSYNPEHARASAPQPEK